MLQQRKFSQLRLPTSLVTFFTVLLGLLSIVYARPKYTAQDLERIRKQAELQHINADKKVIAARKIEKQAAAVLKQVQELNGSLDKLKKPQQLQKASLQMQGLMLRLGMQKSPHFLKIRKLQLHHLSLMKKEYVARGNYLKSLRMMGKAKGQYMGLGRMLRQMSLRQQSLARQYKALSGGQTMTLKQDTNNIFTKPNKNKAKLDNIKKQSKQIQNRQSMTKKAAGKARADFEKAKRAAAKNQRFWKKIKSGLSSAGKAIGGVVKKGGKAAAGVAKKGYNGAKKGVNKAYNAAKKGFSYLYRKARAYAIRKARQLAYTFKNKIGAQVLKKMVTKSYSAYKLTQSKFKLTLKAHLLVKSNRKTIGRQLYALKRKKDSFAKLYAKGAAIQLLSSFGYYTLRTTYNCANYYSTAKRACLTTEITQSMRDAAYDLTSAMIRVTIDIIAIDPFAHSLAAMVASALASVSMGIGAASYPLAYLAASAALNVVAKLVIDVLMKKEFYGIFNRYFLRTTYGWSKSIAYGISEKDLPCLTIRPLCKSTYKGVSAKRTTRSRTTTQRKKARHLGCYLDKPRRDLLYYKGNRFSLVNCVYRCYREGYKFAGIQAGSLCFCGNKAGKYGKRPASECRSLCRYDSKRFRYCGGQWRNHLIYTGR